MVLGVVGALAGLVKSQTSATKVDSRIFRIHYRWTTALLFGGAAFLAATEYFGDPIKCNTGVKAIQTYCWISGVYTLDSKTTEGLPKPYAAQGSSKSGLGPDSNGDPRFHSYYQWVPVVLFIQGCLFYLPHFLWKINEGNHVNNLLQGLQFVKLDEDCDERISKIAKYIKASRGRNLKYFLVYSMFELLNLVNVIGQIFMMDSFFQGGFKSLGSDVLSDHYVDINNRKDVLITIFPRITKCNFKIFGPSGTIENEDSICLLPQNMLNERIFIVVWFWFLTLAVITALHIILRLISFGSNRIRVLLFDLKGRVSNNKNIIVKIESMTHGEYFLLGHLRMNLNYSIFEELLDKIPNDDQMNGPPDSPMLPIYQKGDMVMDTLDLKKRNYASQ